MAKLIVHNPPTVKLKASGYTGTPTGDIELTENNRTYNVSPFATATTAIPEEEKTVTPSTVKQTVTPDNGLLKKVTVEPTPLESKTVTPSTVQKTYKPQAPAIGFSEVIADPVTADIDPAIQPENIKQGVDILGVEGTLKPTPIPVEEKYINFIDYDGTVLYSWTEEELQEATELPPLPEHDGLDSVGWNWSLADIKSQGTSIYVGALFEPSDGKMIMVLQFFEKDNYTVEFSLLYESSQTLLIDWGDGIVEETVASSISHTYASGGIFKIKLSSSNEKAVVLNNTTNVANRLIHLVLNSNIVIKNLISYCYFLETLIVSPTYRDDYYFYLGINVCYAFKAFILPNINTATIQYLYCPKVSISGELTQYLTSMFRYSNIPFFPISHKVPVIPDNLLEANTVLSHIFIPKNVISIGARAFRSNTNLKTIDLSDYDGPLNIPQLSNINTFGSINKNAVFQFRNQSMLDAFAGATNWSTYAAQFVIGGKFAEVTT